MPTISKRWKNHLEAGSKQRRISRKTTQTEGKQEKPDQQPATGLAGEVDPRPEGVGGYQE